MIEFNTNLEKRVAVMMSTSTTRDIDDDETVPIAWRPGRAIEAAQSQSLVNQVGIRVGWWLSSSLEARSRAVAAALTFGRGSGMRTRQDML
jgi:hypothetical protein